MRLVVEIQRIGDQLFDVDFRRTFEAPAVATAPIIATLATSTFTAAASAISRPTVSLWTVALWTIAGRTAAFSALALLTLSAFAPLALLRSISLRTVSLGTIPRWTLGLRGLGRGSFRGRRLLLGSAYLLLCLFRIRHPNL